MRVLAGWILRSVLVAGLLLVGTACGGDSEDGDAAAVTEPTDVSTPATDPADDPDGDPDDDGDDKAAAFDGDWKFTSPQGVSPQEFVLCQDAGCYFTQSNLLAKNGNMTTTAGGVTLSKVNLSIPCTGGGTMTHTFKLVLRADGPNRLVAPGVAMPGGGCEGSGPAKVSFVAVRK